MTTTKNELEDYSSDGEEGVEVRNDDDEVTEDEESPHAGMLKYMSCEAIILKTIRYHGYQPLRPGHAEIITCLARLSS